MAVHGCDPRRVAQIVADGPSGERRASGYLTTATSVLTAAHVVAGATRITVRLDVGQDGEWTTDATVAWADDASDLAVLAVAPSPAAATVAPAEYGTMADTAAVIEVHAAGFPLWKQRQPAAGRQYRELHDATGRLAVMSNRRSGTAEITVTPPADGAGWPGMSGAAVWAGAYIVGVVTSVYPQEGAGRLTAARIDRAVRHPTFAGRTAMPRPGELVDVTPPPTGWRFGSGYREQIRDIAPAGGLHDRDAELAELAAFCAGDEPYMWWQAGPWAGKTALMSTFALSPPAGVDVLSFFVTARLATQADSVAFTDALLDQLAALIGEVLPATLTSGIARDSHRRALLGEAVNRSERAGRRLVLLVDGLDEDRGGTPGSGLASIASLLPKVVGPGLRVIVSSRQNPPLPSDVSADHPLRHCRCRPLAVSPYATETARLARRELDELLNGDQAQQDILGLVAASGGGLTLVELEELSGLPRYRLEGLLGGVFGRTIGARDEATGLGFQRSFTLAHETLRVEAIERIGGRRLRTYRVRLHEWADGYRNRGWPAETPAYLLRGYPRMLQETGDHHRLVALAADAARHDRSLLLTGGDAAALREIKVAQDAVKSQRVPSLGDLTVLAMRRDDLVARNSTIPPDLPAVWAALGQHARAHALADGIADPARRAAALAALARVTAAAGDDDPITAVRDLVEQLHGRPGEDQADPVRVNLAAALAYLRRTDPALELVQRITDPVARVEAMLGVLGATDEDGLADRITGDILVGLSGVADGDTARVLSARVALALAERGDHRRGRELLDAEAARAEPADPDRRARRTALLARTATALGDAGRARQLALRSELQMRSVVNDVQPRLRSKVDDAIQREELDWAEALAQRLAQPRERVEAFLAVALAAWPDHRDTATRLCGVVNEITDGGRTLAPSDALQDLALLDLLCGDTDRAVGIALRIGDLRAASAAFPEVVPHGVPFILRRSVEPPEVSAALAGLAFRAAAVRDFDAAVAVMDRIGPVSRRCVVAARLVTLGAEAGERQWARNLAARIAEQLAFVTDPTIRGLVSRELRTAVTALAAPAGPRRVAAPAANHGPSGGETAARVRELVSAMRTAPPEALEELACQARMIAARAASLGDQDAMLTHVALALARAGARDLALSVAGDMLYGLRWTNAAWDVMQAMLAVADLERAETVALNIDDRRLRALALARLSDLAVSAGAQQRGAALRADAERVAYAVGDQQQRAAALTDLAFWLVGNGEDLRASVVAADAEKVARVLTDPVRRATAQADLAYALLGTGDGEGAHRLAAACSTIVRNVPDLTVENALAFRLIRPLKAGGTDPEFARSLILRHVADPGRLAAELIDLAKRWAGSGAPIPPGRLVDGVNDPVVEAIVAYHHACEADDKAGMNAVERLALGLPDLDKRVVTVARLAAIAAATAHRRRASSMGAQAVTLIDAFTPGSSPSLSAKSEASEHLARAAADLGEHDRAWRYAEAVSADTSRGKVQADLVILRCAAGDSVGARKAAESIAEAPNRAVVLSRLAALLTGRGDDAGRGLACMEAAVTTGRALSNPSLRAVTLSRVARSAGWPESLRLAREAEDTAAAIVEPERRAMAWVDIAVTYARAGDPEAGRRLVVATLEIATWSAVLPVLTVLEPAALLRLAAVAEQPEVPVEGPDRPVTVRDTPAP